jgi:hypothetical protein
MELWARRRQDRRMELALLNWLVADVSLLGLQAQNWMLVFAAVFVLYGCIYLLRRKRGHG